MKICTYTRDLGNTIEAMTAAEWAAGGKAILDSADEWVWQEADTKEAAIERHETAHAAWRADIDAGRAERNVY